MPTTIAYHQHQEWEHESMVAWRKGSNNNNSSEREWYAYADNHERDALVMVASSTLSSRRTMMRPKTRTKRRRRKRFPTIIEMMTNNNTDLADQLLYSSSRKHSEDVWCRLLLIFIIFQCLVLNFMYTQIDDEDYSSQYHLIIRNDVEEELVERGTTATPSTMITQLHFIGTESGEY